jgi:hypothetical protein
LQKAGIISEVVNPPFCAPLIVIPKKDGKLRLVIDYRQLNDVTPTEPYTLNRIDELMSNLGENAFVSTFDMAKGYFQIPLSKDCRILTAFICAFGVYQFNRLPQGIKNAPACFQRIMNALLADCYSFATAYLDDIIIYSSSWQEHKKHLCTIFEKIRRAGFTLAPNKTQLMAEKIHFLGFEFSRGKISPAEIKVLAVNKVPRPVTKTDVRSFLGMVGYYSRHIPGYAGIAAPLTDLCKGEKKAKVEWTEACTVAFDTLKKRLMEPEILRSPKWDEPFYVFTDGSGIAIAGVIMQSDDASREYFPVAYVSRKLQDREKRYFTTEIELLAIVYTLSKFEYYLRGRHFILYTDHNPLVTLRTLHFKNARISRWILFLQTLDFDVRHLSGKFNKIADCLSRYTA